MTRKLPWLFFALLALAGLLTFRHYGQSWDEPLFYAYAEAIPAAYAPQNWFNAPESVYGPSAEDHKYYGPAYLLLAAPLRKALSAAFDLPAAETWHLLIFFTFLLGVWFLYRLARRSLPLPAALTAAALFALQPTLWGHAFLNPKDIPFFTAFTAAVWLGLRAADRMRNGQPAWGAWAAAALALGFASAIRVIGPFAALLVLGYSLLPWPSQRPVWRSLLLYAALSALVMFLLWPFLWQSPVTRLLEVLRHMSNNPTELAVLFLGQIFRANDMPTRYFPQMLLLTLTLPVWPLAALGVWRMARLARREFAVYAAWFGLIAAYILLRHPAVYDGFRHFLFILPPVFALTGHGAHLLSQKLADWKTRQPSAREAASPRPAARLRLKVSLPAALSLLLLILLPAPGVWSILRLHPYEYAYYNALAGGLSGAYRVYETDYWLTCYREALEWAQTNDPQTPIYIQREMDLAGQYAAGLRLLPLEVETPTSLPGGARLLFSTRANLDQRSIFRNLPVEQTFGREDAVFCLFRRVE